MGNDAATTIFGTIGIDDGESFYGLACARAAVLTVLRDTYAVGRGLPVTRDMLLQKQSPVAKLKYAGAVAELAEELSGEGSALLEALRDRRIKGFQQRKADELENWLATEGHLDDRALVSPEEFLPRILAASAESMNRSGLTSADARETIQRALSGHVIY